MNEYKRGEKEALGKVIKMFQKFKVEYKDKMKAYEEKNNIKVHPIEFVDGYIDGIIAAMTHYHDGMDNPPTIN